MSLNNFKQPRIRSCKHKRFINSLPCIGCNDQKTRSHAHHVGSKRLTGMGVKVGDDRCAPLCFDCHIVQLHQKGEERFYRKLGGRGKVESLIYNLHKNTGDEDSANELIRRFKDE